MLIESYYMRKQYSFHTTQTRLNSACFNILDPRIYKHFTPSYFASMKSTQSSTYSSTGNWTEVFVKIVKRCSDKSSGPSSRSRWSLVLFISSSRLRVGVHPLHCISLSLSLSLNVYVHYVRDLPVRCSSPSLLTLSPWFHPQGYEYGDSGLRWRVQNPEVFYFLTDSKNFCSISNSSRNVFIFLY